MPPAKWHFLSWLLVVWRSLQVQAVPQHIRGSDRLLNVEQEGMLMQTHPQLPDTNMLGSVLMTEKQRPTLALRMGISRGEGRSLSANKDFMLSIGSVAVLVLVFAYMMLPTSESTEKPTEGQFHDTECLAEKLPAPGCTLTPMPVNITSQGVPSIPKLDLDRHSPNNPYSMSRTDPSPQAPTTSAQYTASKSILRDPTRDLADSEAGASPSAPSCDDNGQGTARTAPSSARTLSPPSAPTASTFSMLNPSLLSRCRDIMAKADANKARNDTGNAKSKPSTATTTVQS